MAIVPLLIKDGIFAVVQSNQAKLRALGVKRLGLFGSFVHGEQKPDSDVDFLVEFEPDTKTFKNFMGVWDVLEEVLCREIDMGTPESLSPYIGPRILQTVEYVPFAY